MLWTNANPTSGMAQGATISLSDSYLNYDFIKVNYRFSNTDSRESSVIYPKSEVTKSVASSNDSRMMLGGYYTSSTTNYARLMYRPDANTNDSFTVSTGRQMLATGTSNNVLIPTSIVGCNFK